MRGFEMHIISPGQSKREIRGATYYIVVVCRIGANFRFDERGFPRRWCLLPSIPSSSLFLYLSVVCPVGRSVAHPSIYPSIPPSISRSSPPLTSSPRLVSSRRLAPSRLRPSISLPWAVDGDGRSWQLDRRRPAQLGFFQRRQAGRPAGWPLTSLQFVRFPRPSARPLARARDRSRNSESDPRSLARSLSPLGSANLAGEVQVEELSRYVGR